MIKSRSDTHAYKSLHQTLHSLCHTIEFLRFNETTDKHTKKNDGRTHSIKKLLPDLQRPSLKRTIASMISSLSSEIVSSIFLKMPRSLRSLSTV